MPGSDGEQGESGAAPSLPQGMSIPVLPQAPAPVSTIEGGLQGAARVADTIGGAITMATQVSQMAEGASAEQVIPAVFGGLGSALGGASTVASGIDPGVSQALGVVSAAASLVGGAGGMMRSLVDAIEGAVSESNRHRVTFEFESPALPMAEWMVARWTLEEHIGRPYSATIVLATEDLDVDVRSLLGALAKLILRRGEDHQRVLGGIVQRVEIGRTTDRARMITIEVVPALALLALRKDSRIFQDLEATDILDAALGGALEGYARELELRTRRTYKRREYCVQYGETDLDFAHRLMEEEGITYFFEWDADGVEKLILVDGRDGMPSLLPDDESIPFVQQRSETSETEHVHELLRTTQMRTTSFALTDLDWTQLRANAVIDAHSHGEDGRARSRERYDHDRAVTLGAYRGSAYQASDAEVRLAMRREAHVAREKVLRGAGNVLRLSPGRTITIEDHPIEELDGELLVLSVSHRGHAPELHDLLGAERYAADDVSYECSFEAIPETTPYRMPEVTPKPRVHGMLSAVVVGANGQEIHSDEHRRVRIQLRWDREGTFDERSSCLVRVLQSWAGAGFGTMFLPRVGMEVAVAFLDGDPDRPMVAGCLYDADNESPYRTEAEWTKSGIRTKSSPDRGGHHFNELTFDDAAGHERIFVHAEKDLDEVVEHDHTTHVSRNQTHRIDGDQRETIGGDQHLRVRGDRYRNVEGIEEIAITNSRRLEIGTDERHIVGGLQHETVAGKTTLEHQDQRELHVHGFDNESYGDGRNVFVRSADQTTVQGSSQLFVHGARNVIVDTSHLVKKGESELTVANAITLVVGQTSISVSPNGHITLAAPNKLELVCGQAMIAMQSSGQIDILGPAGVNIACGSTSVALSPMGVETSATQISATAIADHTIVGAIVRIN